MKKVLSVLMALVIIFGLSATLSGCYGESIEGTWYGEIELEKIHSMSLYTKDWIDTLNAFSDYMDSELFSVEYSFEFSDGKLKIYIEDYEKERYIEKYVDAFTEAYKLDFKDRYPQLEVNQAAQDSGYGSVKLLVEEVHKVSKRDLDENLPDVIYEGKYEFEDGKLMLTEYSDNQFDFIKCELDGENLELESAVGAVPMDLKALLPLELEK